MFDAAPREFGSSRALIATAALAVGLLTGFAGGYVTGQDNQAASWSVLEHPAGQGHATPATAEEPAHAYTETPIAEPPAEVAVPEVAPAPAAVAVAARASPRAPAPGRTGTVVVVSRPPGARVFLDERLVGTTPLSLGGVAAGRHGVRIALPEYRRWATAVTITGGTSVRVAASLER